MPELLSPAGNFEKLKAAVRFGADAVYLAGRRFGMRATDNFDHDELIEAVRYAHAHGVKVYITVNTMPREQEYGPLREYLASLKEAGPDALIIADIGVLALAREVLPDMELHISTQASIVSHYTCEEYRKLGAKRLVLARELTLNEIKEIAANLSEGLELEVFIHGSMCVSYSGRCLLSEYYTGRDANRGMCAQPCRWSYKHTEIYEDKRPESPLPVEEGPDGTFIMSSKDMCMIEHIPELMECGVHSFKIEGRMKSAYYVAAITNAYRMAMDAYASDPDGYGFDQRLQNEVESVSHREYCTGYFFHHPLDEPQRGTQLGYLKENAYLAYVKSYDPVTKLATFVQRNKMFASDRVELLTPGQVGRAFVAEQMYLPAENGVGEEIESSPHPFMEYVIKMPFDVKEGDILRGC